MKLEKIIQSLDEIRKLVSGLHDAVLLEMATRDKKIIVDQTSLWLVDALKKAGFRKAWDISHLGFDPNASISDFNIARRISIVGKETPKSGYLFITANYKHYEPKGFDIVGVPSELHKEAFISSLQKLVAAIPPEAQNKKYYARSAGRGKYQRYDFPEIK